MPAAHTFVHARIVASLAAVAAVAVATACSSNSGSGGAGTPGILTIAAGDNTNETVGNEVGPFVVKVTDTAGTVLPNVQVHFVASSGLTLTSTTDTTSEDGTTFTSGTLSTVSGLDSIIATVSGISTPVVFHITANPDIASSITLAGGNNQSGAAGTMLGEVLAVRVTDKYSNPISGVQVGWDAVRGMLGSTIAFTNMSGVSQVSYTLPAGVGPQTVTASATIGSTVTTITFTETAN